MTLNEFGRRHLQNINRHSALLQAPCLLKVRLTKAASSQLTMGTRQNVRKSITSAHRRLFSEGLQWAELCRSRAMLEGGCPA